MSYFILLIWRGTKYRNGLIITSSACQVHRRPTRSSRTSLAHLNDHPGRHKRAHSNRPPSRLLFSKHQLVKFDTSNSTGLMLLWSGHQLRKAWQEPKRSIYRIKLPRKGRMMIKLILSISFMFSGCLGSLDSNGMDDVVDHEYDTLPPSTLDARKATPRN
jgi:hypothetical protein